MFCLIPGLPRDTVNYRSTLKITFLYLIIQKVFCCNSQATPCYYCCIGSIGLHMWLIHSFSRFLFEKKPAQPSHIPGGEHSRKEQPGCCIIFKKGKNLDQRNCKNVLVKIPGT